jgi:hypothetical protein
MTIIQFKRMWRPVAALAFVALVILALMFQGGRASAAGGIVPPGLVKGAQFQILISSGGGIGPETLEVIETDGTWVHAKIVQSGVWGQGDIWVNLAATDFGYVKVIGIPKPPQ